MQADFLTEAKKYNVLPLDDRFVERADPSLRPSLIEGRNQFLYYSGTAHVPEDSAAPTKNRSHTIIATIDVPKTGSPDGALVANGGTSSGFSIYIKNGKPTYAYNWFTEERTVVRSSESVKPGRNVIKADFHYDGGGLGKGGTVTLYLNDKKVGEGRVPKTVPARFSASEAFDTGLDSGSPVSEEYASPFKFPGTVDKVEIDIEPTNLSKTDQKQLELAMVHAIMGIQ